MADQQATPKETDDVKLAYLKGALESTVNSITSYSSEALIDRMRWLLAVLNEDEEGKQKHGRLCLKEQKEQHPETYGESSETNEQSSIEIVN